MIKLVTHNQGFHADDVMAYAILKEVLTKRGEAWSIVRTRDDEIINNSDIAFDIGYEYNPARHRYDHHQTGKAGKRDNGIEYAACGLVWKHFGRELCSETIWKTIDKSMIQEMDAIDNGQTFIKEYVFPDSFNTSIVVHIARFEPSELEEKTPENLLAAFEDASEFARGILVRAIKDEEYIEKSYQDLVEIYDKAQDKRILVSEKNVNRPTISRISEYTEPVYIIYFNLKNNDWKVEAVPVNILTRESRKLAPQSWRGLRDGELQQITGVSDATFCHPSGFLFGAKSFDGAMELAKLAISK